MADTLFFSRDTKVFVEIGSTVWEIPVLDGFSFSQSTNASEVTLNEMADASGNSRRARQMFTDSYAPAEWSFSTYMRPFKTTATGDTTAGANAGDHHAVEEALWALAVGDAAYNATTKAFTGFTRDDTDLDIDFASSNKVTLGTANIYFVMGKTGGTTKVYKLEGAVVNEVSMDFDIDGIATCSWSGFASIIDTTATAPTVDVDEGGTAADTGNFIRNRLTSLEIEDDINTVTYNLVLTGGNVTISNNLTFLTPETIGIVNQPIGHVTGTRSVSGSFTCYLNAPDSGSSSVELFKNIIEDTGTITNNFALTFAVGGSNGTPRVELAMADCHLEVPSHSIEDVISVETSFHALPSAIGSANELAVKYVGA